MIMHPRAFKTRQFDNPEAATAAIREIYDANVAYLRERFIDFTTGNVPMGRVSACYPYLRFETDSADRIDTRRPYGFVHGPGVFQSTLTRPDIFASYYQEQISLLLRSHGGVVEVGVSDSPIPIHFALGENFHVEGDLTPDLLQTLPRIFDLPDLELMDDQIANGTWEPREGAPRPLSLFTAPRVDVSVMRLKHYTGTSAHHCQNFVIFTNYQFYIDEFTRICHDIMAETDDKSLKGERMQYVSFVEPGDAVTLNRNIPHEQNPDRNHASPMPLKRMPQMPGYHLKRADGSGITMINIGVGPSNAKTISDHVAVLRPHAWLMLGHCAGLRTSQNLGDYVLAHAYLRLDHVLDKDLPPEIPLPALAEIQVTLEKAVENVTGMSGLDLKKIMRTGTVATIDDRNWEFQPSVKQNLAFAQSRAIGLDMESCTIAANGYRFRVPYGTLLCVSDKPLHGQLKLPGMADTFYRNRVNQHLQIGLLAMTMLRDYGIERLHSRKLRSFNEVAFQ